ncbi:MAG: hypothetical protein E5Y88_22380 [Mesorhizobium sp.]|uniref:Uncharacterized protein n=1 Tax=Mesorhizobium escarrei TaxID=666018 RepID=A0ABN8KKP8_9HYPH|nr:hypothetical protein [Mesorhizobium sp.]TIL23675.1 MAG: hypothetical protein E5Y88_22380 [Mesorhizobium sp.]CAH2409379.1 hypothetical protein MES5069_830026 [Mesorhizobium escarrei]
MTAFAIDSYDAEFEAFKTDGTSTWKPCQVVGATIKADGEPAYVIETTGGLQCLLVVDYVRKPEPYFPRRRSA